jgi:hypothetical protein
MACFRQTYTLTLLPPQRLWPRHVCGRHYAEDVVKGVSLPHVLSARPGRRRQFAVPRYVRIKLAIRLAVTTAALSKGRSPCRVMDDARMIPQSQVCGSLFMIRGVGKTWGTS